MQREVIWQRIDGGVGLEHLWLSVGDNAVKAEGTLLAIEENKPLLARYSIRCDARWHVREVTLGIERGAGEPPRSLALRSSGEGHWESQQAPPDASVGPGWKPRPDLDGCLEIDIYPSPFTNTLPIRRLQLAVGESALIHVAFIRLPELTVQPVQQRYTRLATTDATAAPDAAAAGARYRYEGLESGYTTELPVDDEGLVVEYPGWFGRAFP